MKEEARDDGLGKGEARRGRQCDELRFRDAHKIFVIGQWPLVIWKNQIPSWEGQKPKASGWVVATKNPPRRCREGFSSLHLPRGICRPPSNSYAKFR